MNKFKVFCTRKLHSKALDLLSESFDFSFWDNYDKIPKADLISQASDCDGILSMLEDDLSEDTLKNFPNLKVISNYAVGVNNIDHDYCKKMGIQIGNTPDVLSDATADLALALLLSVNRKLPASFQSIKNGEWKAWSPIGFLGQDLRGKTLGIVGLGRIGACFAHKCQKLYGNKIIYYNRNKSKYEQELEAKKVSLEELCKQSDIISLHCPLNSESENLFDKKLFDMMRPNCIFINTARGQIHNEKDLYEALKNNKICAAGLDVTNPEPMSPDAPLLELSNIAITPHIGSAVDKTREEMAMIAANNLIKYFTANN